MTDLSRLAERVRAATGADRALDQDLYEALGDPQRDEDGTLILYRAPTYTASIDAARGLVHRMLPGFWVSSGLCATSGHCSMGPDYNGPDRERLLREWPPERFDVGPDAGFHADLAPGDGPHRECYAILAALLSALSALEGGGAP